MKPYAFSKKGQKLIEAFETAIEEHEYEVDRVRGFNRGSTSEDIQTAEWNDPDCEDARVERVNAERALRNYIINLEGKLKDMQAAQGVTLNEHSEKSNPRSNVHCSRASLRTK